MELLAVGSVKTDVLDTVECNPDRVRALLRHSRRTRGLLREQCIHQLLLRLGRGGRASRATATATATTTATATATATAAPTMLQAGRSGQRLLLCVGEQYCLRRSLRTTNGRVDLIRIPSEGSLRAWGAANVSAPHMQGGDAQGCIVISCRRCRCSGGRRLRLGMGQRWQHGGRHGRGGRHQGIHDPLAAATERGVNRTNQKKKQQRRFASRESWRRSICFALIW